MRIYRCLWFTATAVIVSSVAMFDVVAFGWLRLAVVGLVMALFGWLLGFVLAEGRADRWLWTRRVMVWSAFGAVAADGLVMTLGRAGAVIGLVILVTSPAALRLIRGTVLRWSSRRTSGPPEMLATRDLLRRWEWTTAEVARADTSMSRRLALVEERRRLLDEIQDRDPSHFDLWVASTVPDGADRQRPGHT